MKKVAFMFPGQGSQQVGMGQEFFNKYPEVQAIYDEANNILNKDLKGLMLDGPSDVLTETENAQPALLLCSYAIHSILAQHQIEPVAAVGHSLGEYSALVAAGAISLQEALPLVELRGKLMEEAYPKGQGSMAAVLGLDQIEIEEALQQLSSNEIVDIANLNCPGQIVISGSKEGIDQAGLLLTDVGARRVIPLNVSGPFHSRLMKKANEEFAEEINTVSFSNSKLPVYANVTASPVTDRHEMKELLIKQMYSPVRFEESIRQMIKQGINVFVEVGHGRVLSGLVRKIDRKVHTFSVQDPSSMEKFITWYKEESL